MLSLLEPGGVADATRSQWPMSTLTLKLMRRPRSRGANRWHARLQAITELLVAEYGTPSLGNFADPIKEVFYIVLSAKTTEALYRNAHRRLWTRFRTLSAIAAAPLSEIQECVANAGLGGKRSLQIKQIASRLIENFGSRPGPRLRKLSAEEAYAYLRSLPGIGPKSAFCVMMYSLGFDVFPVDAHAQRVLRRIGLPQKGAKHYHAQEQLPAFIPEGRSRDLHVALVVHGRAVCKPVSPLCSLCPISTLCSTANQRLARTMAH
jgi:endonuclease III